MEKEKQFDAIIIGFGKAGKTLAVALGNVGKRTVLIEKSPQMYGGTCINEGCIPTKFLAHKAKGAKSFTSFADKQAYYQQAVEEELALVAKLRANNLMKVETTPNVTVMTGIAKLRSANQVEVLTKEGVEILRGEKIFLNTGSRPIIPPIDGIMNTSCVVTSAELLRQKRLPKNLVIIGGGYIGVEFASMYVDFGSKVTVIQNDEQFLPREDREIAAAVYENLKSRGVELLFGAEMKSVKKVGERAFVAVGMGSTLRNIEADTVLIATGRKPNIEGLGLEYAGIKLTTRGGVATDEHLCAAPPNVYAMGDVVGGLQFTYISLDDFRIVCSAVLGGGSYTTKERGVLPYSVFLNPPFSRVGMSEQEAIEKGYSVKIARLPAAAIPKALVMEQPVGVLKAVIDEQTGRILGAHLFCEESHEMINTVKLVMDAKLPYTILRDMIFTHPTMSEAFNTLCDV